MGTGHRQGSRERNTLRLERVEENPTTLRTTRGVQQPLFNPTWNVRQTPAAEPKGVVYTKRWVVDLVLDLSGYCPENNLVDVLAVEPSAGDGAFLGNMVERLIACCARLGRPLSDCRGSLLAFELDEEGAERARRLAIRILTEHGTDSALAECLAAGWVRTGDYLLQTAALEADFVVGNPPYIRLEDIPDKPRLCIAGYIRPCGDGRIFM